MIELCKWSFIPGPASDPSDSSLNLHDIVHYPPEEFAEAVLAYPGMMETDPPQPSWWAWAAIWESERESIVIGMSLFETEPVSWGGSPLQGACKLSTILYLWNAIRHRCPGVWMHNDECEIHTPESFEILLRANSP